MIDRILRIKEELGPKLLIPAHHYQRPEIVAIADITGDSYKLAVDVSASDADYIVFCGVRFMAEGASVLSKPHQKIFLPDVSAACPMAGMITERQAERALAGLNSVSSAEVVPVVYMNAHADSKAFCGRNGGAVCTSSNAEKILDYYFSKGYSVFFFPDQHLGINTGRAMGLGPDEIKKISKDFTVVSIESEPVTDMQARIYVWDGYCPVHQKFSKEQESELRKTYPDIKIVVHPEVDQSTAKAADLTGSTQQIYNMIRDSAPGTTWGVGTDFNFVRRIAEEFSSGDKTVLPLERHLCADMNKTTLESLFSILKAIQETDRKAAEDTAALPQEISVPEDIRRDASAAINRMIEIVEGA